MRTLGIKEIMATIPHRQPFLLVDKAEIIEEGKKPLVIRRLHIMSRFLQAIFQLNQ